jgi:hypothetical protein
MRPHHLLFALIVLLAGTASADKKHFRYVGIHPIAKAYGGGMCHIEAPHVHVYAPLDVKVNYRDHDGYNYFIGDPVAYQWDGPRTAYYGHHPVPVDVVIGDDYPDTEYCYLEGPHYHAWAPPASLDLELHGDAYWYTGEFPEAYVKGKVVYDPIDVVYKPIAYARPVVVVDAPPPHWYGGVTLVVAAPLVEVHAPPPPHVRAEVVVPAVRVEVGLPSIEIGIGAHVHAGGHYDDDHHHRHDNGRHKGWKRGKKHW